MMKRLLMIAAVVVAALAIAVVSLSAFVTGERTRARVEAELSRWLGASVRVGEPVSLALRMTPVLTLQDVDLEDTRIGWALQDARIDVDLALSALLSGDAEVSAIAISGGRITLPRQTDGDDMLAGVGKLAASLSDEIRQLLRHPLQMKGATLVRTLERGGQDILATDVSFRISAAETGSVNLRGALNAGDQTVQWTASLSDRKVLAGPGEGGLVVTVASPLATLRLDGQLLRADTAWFRGDMEFSASDLRGLAGRFGHDLAGEGAAFGAARLVGSGEISATALAMTQAEIEFDGNQGGGRLVLDLAGARPRLEGTLAFETLDLSAHVAEGASAAAEGVAAGWLRQPFGSVLSRADVDLRLSATRLVAGNIAVGPTAVSILLRDRDLSIDIGETLFEGGGLDLSARLRPDPEGKGFLGTASLAFDRFPAVRVPLPDRGPAPTAGSLSGRTQWNGRGENLDALVAAASGTATVKAFDLRFADGGVDTLLAGLLGSGGAVDTSVPSFFDLVSVEATGTMEALKVASARAYTPAHVLNASGRVTLPSGALSLGGELRKRRPGDAPNEDGGAGRGHSADTGGGKTVPAPASQHSGLPVLVRGTLSEPLVVPDLTRLEDRPTR